MDFDEDDIALQAHQCYVYGARVGQLQSLGWNQAFQRLFKKTPTVEGSMPASRDSIRYSMNESQSDFLAMPWISRGSLQHEIRKR